ncbi:ABC transporter ATP-binding protein [Hyphococcus luteus]|uniref:Nitrate/sulfonate/bicarbonate ABC transporter ATP-binding protein n=1 Tax=Hyphococcus luteus TaxID=2058213 RepID=A0A2S7K1J5_9PROT|nr:ABC transporter ATP-binding protein [Marinicaulis flavus]PQA86366.1 nitrate/sulfonate/bicarbonate ABC transporter ATP-binding protein [Marinicaulis flavus]
MPIFSLNNVSKSYGGEAVLSDINLDVEENEFVAIVGFSGSGKTTLISLIAGLIGADEGEIVFDGAPARGAAPERGVVFQNYSLMPWLSVAGNVRLAVDAIFPKMPAKEKAARVAHYVDMVGLSQAKDRRPAELSGGMRQRVNVARALAIQPKLLLLDEPLSALDALTRANLQDEIERIWENERKTVILITNDVDEALLLADRIIPLTPGPNATLGPAFNIRLDRPRDRKAVNHDPEFIRLRAAITDYLMKIGMERPGNNAELELPDVAPLTATQGGLKNGLKEAKARRKRDGGKVIDLAASKPLQDPDLPDPVKEAGKPHTQNLNKYVEFFKVTKAYPTPKGPLTVVDDFTLDLHKGEFISLIGHSGCGKSTVLSMAAGLNPITEGGIVLDGKEISGAGPDRGVVFQSPSLFPWLTAYENIALGVERVYPHISKIERHNIIEYYLGRVGLAGAMHKRASDLSNGMQQRVGIARAFALSPKLLLLDEPFGMLDSLTRWELQEVLMDVWKRTQVTAICVTHDVDEAILVADRIIMMTNGPHARVGKIMEVGLPRPRSRKALLEHPDYYKYREQLLTFLEEYETHDKSAA